MIIRRRIDQLESEISWIRKHRAHKGAISEWQREFALFIGVRHARVIPSGRAGLVHVMSKLNLNKGDEIIIPAYTLKDLVPLIQEFGVRVIPADISKKDFNIDPADIKKKITDKTKLIIAAHIFGCPCDMPSIMKIARRYKIFVLEDCAHSAGSIIQRRQTGSFGDAAFFSFENIKPINTYGGGMIVSNSRYIIEGLNVSTENPIVQKKARTAWLENTLVHSPLSYIPLYLMSTGLRKHVTGLYRVLQGTPTVKGGYSAVQARLGRMRLKSLERRIRKRRAIAGIYRKMLMIPFQPDAGHNYYFMVGLFRGDTNSLKRKMIKKGIDIGIRDEVTDLCTAACPNAKYVYEHAVQLPMHEHLTRSNLRKICNYIQRLI